MGSSHSYLVNLEAQTVTAVPKYTNPNHVSPLSPVYGFTAQPQVNHLDQLTGYVQVPNKNISPEAIVLYQADQDCKGTSTSVSSTAPVPNSVQKAKPVYNQCGELIGYIGAVVKNAAAPASVMLL